MSLPDPEFWRDRKVFLTGHTGFKGGWLALWLHRLGAIVQGYALAPPTTPNFFAACGIETRLADQRADIRDGPTLLESVQSFRPHIVFHLAAQPLVRAAYAAPAETFATNVMGTVNLLDAVRQTPGILAAIIVTSDKVYAESAETAHTENDPLGGRDPYSASKAAAEFCAAAFPLKCGLATVRAGNVIGGGDFAADRLLPDFFRATAAGTPLALRNPGAVRPWQHVLEPLRGYLLAAEFCADHPGTQQAWNFGPGPDGELAVAEVASRLCALWGDDAAYEIAPDPGAPRESPVLRLNAEKAGAQLLWQPVWDLDQALIHTTAWYRAFAAGAKMAAVSLRQIADFTGAAP
jgi:CDP-glucose 4,6-dehydratase